MTELQTLAAHERDLGGFSVRRLLPAAARPAVGPFVFFDHFGPLEVLPGANHDVRPHPHIGLATLTYLFEGAIQHRDSTGVVQRIEPGAVNWMSAGRGITHSERTPKDLLGAAHTRHGLQLWVALPDGEEESAPSFQHVAAAELPELRRPGVAVRIVAGTALGETSPLRVASPTLMLVLDFAAASPVLELPPLAEELALYAIDHPLEVDEQVVDEHVLAVLPAGTGTTLRAPRGGRVVVVGGAPVGPRVISWNFVSSSRERIRQAEADWLAQRFPAVPGETEFIPLPQRPPAARAAG